VSEPIASEIRVRITSGFTSPGSTTPIALGRTLAARQGRGGDRSVLVRGDFHAGADVTVLTSDCVALPEGVEPATAPLVLPVATALSLWQSLDLELGEAAVWTTGGALSSLAGQVALWRGACPGIELGPSSAGVERIAGSDRIDWTDAEEAATRLNELVQGRPGFVAVDLSGRADVIDVLLEAMPTFGRLLLAGPAGDPVTIDFYKNVHRKGAVIRSTVLDPALAFEPSGGTTIRAEIPRAVNLLANPAMAERCSILTHYAPSGPLAIAG
jgi:threonine dehydrogenase-like Zn-dependent dehydrogenase